MIKRTCFLLLALSFSQGIQIVPPSHAEQETLSQEAQSMKELYEQGVKAMEASEYQKAIGDFQKILLINPKIAAVHNLIGICYLKQGGDAVSKAIDEMNEAIKIDPQYAEAYSNLGSIYSEPSDYRDIDSAIENFEKAIAIDPKFGRAYFGLAWLMLTERNDARKAVPLFEKAVEISPDLVSAYVGLGFASVQSNQKELALKPISMLRKLNREDLALQIEAAMNGGDDGLNRPVSETESPMNSAYGTPPPVESESSSQVDAAPTTGSDDNGDIFSGINWNFDQQGKS